MTISELERVQQSTTAPKLISGGTRPVTGDKRKEIV